MSLYLAWEIGRQTSGPSRFLMIHARLGHVPWEIRLHLTLRDMLSAAIFMHQRCSHVFSVPWPSIACNFEVLLPGCNAPAFQWQAEALAKSEMGLALRMAEYRGQFNVRAFGGQVNVGKPMIENSWGNSSELRLFHHGFQNILKDDTEI